MWRTWSPVDEATFGDFKTFRCLGHLKEGPWRWILRRFLDVSFSLLPVCFAVNFLCHTLSWPDTVSYSWPRSTTPSNPSLRNRNQVTLETINKFCFTHCFMYPVRVTEKQLIHFRHVRKKILYIFSTDTFFFLPESFRLTFGWSHD